MGFSTAFKNALLDNFKTGEFLSLHDADPGDTGASEISGGSPAYARKAVTLANAANGVQAHSSQPVFDVPAGKTVRYVGRWSAASAGSWRGSFAVTAETFGGQGTYTVDSGEWDLT